MQIENIPIKSLSIGSLNKKIVDVVVELIMTKRLSPRKAKDHANLVSISINLLAQNIEYI